jgi:hypothetical protein
VISQRDGLGNYLNGLGLLGTGVEVGVFRGEFAQQILKTWRGRKLILVDTWRHLHDYHDSWNLSDVAMEKNYRLTLARLACFTDRAVIHRMRSEDAALSFPDASCDFIYLDANHAYEAVKRDLQQWFPKLRVGGLMSGHDYFDAMADECLDPILGESTQHLRNDQLTSYGVRRAVDEFTASLGVTPAVTEERLPSWYFVK